MRVTDEQYNYFRNETAELKDRLEQMEVRVGDVPMTVRFIRSIDNLVSDMQQMYFEEIKGDKEKKLDAQVAGYFQGR